MGQSLVKNLIHIVFSTKYRQELIYPPIEAELHSYLGGVCKNLDCYPIKIGGYTDHVHVLCSLSQKITLARLVGELKSYSSGWMKTKHPSLRNFYWQGGYGAFSVKPSEVERVVDYIANQHEHHKQKTFRTEFIEFLTTYKIEYDERYIWE